MVLANWHAVSNVEYNPYTNFSMVGKSNVLQLFDDTSISYWNKLHISYLI